MPRRRYRNPKAARLIVDVPIAAALLGVAESTLYRWLNEGTFPGFRIGVYWRIKLEDVARAMHLSIDDLLSLL